MTKSAYSAGDIEVLEGLEPVRERPGMFIAGTDTPDGLHHLVLEILDNSVDEAMNGHGDRIDVTLHADGQSVTIADRGRGIPVDNHPKYKKPALELILTTLHAGGKFSAKNYQTAGGLHGVGSSVVNALSQELVARIRRDGKEYEQHFSRGKATTALKVVRKSVNETGTTIFFRPDSTIFLSIDFSGDRISSALRTKAYLNPGLTLFFTDEQKGQSVEYLYQDGLVSYLSQLLKEREVTPIGGELFSIEKNDEAEVRVALSWTEETKEEFFSYANGIYTPEGGSHEQGAKSGILRAIRNYMNVHESTPAGVKITGEDIREGMIVLVSVKLPGDKFKAQFQGQTKSKLNNPEVAPIVESAMKALEQQLNEKPTVAQAIINRVILSSKARAASRAAVLNVTRKIGVSHRLTLPGKLADCSSSKTGETELFIVEGDSAGGSAKQGRDRQFQAVLPLRGKVLNTIASASKKILENKELSNIVSALGTGISENCRPERLRYGKIIILTDADADGMHISTLLLGFFFAYMRPLINAGAIYLGKPPLYGIYPKGSKAAGMSSKKANGKGTPGVFWAYSDAELQKIIAKEKLSGPRVVRYKGLGEMNPDTLWDTTLDPKTRTLLRVTIENENDVRQGFEALMGSDASARYHMIQSFAPTVELDI